MSDRAKEKRFVISGKERLDVGLHEDEFLLQAVFYCMGAGPNPDCRPSMLAWSGSAATPFYAEIYKPTIFVYILTVMV